MGQGSPTAQPVPRGERWGLVLLLLLFVGLGVIVEIRSALLTRRMGDLTVYLRAAWAVRQGISVYDLAEDNGWHYSYPPLYAILLTPLADPPRNVDHAGYLPYPVSVAICYLFNVLCLAVGVHWLASALERASARPEVLDQPRFCRRWWLLRVLPVVVCLPTIGHTLVRGQVNLLLLALIAGFAAGLMRQRSWLAGVSLAGAICLKIFPIFLLLVPLWRRDARCLLGCCAGLVVGLGLIPTAVLGPTQTVTAYGDLARVLIGPALHLGGDSTRAKELIEVTATDSQSFLAVLHNSLHLNRDTRPHEASSTVLAIHFLIGGLLTLITLWAGRREQRARGLGLLYLIGCLTLVMILLSPVCHTHYFCLELPLIMGLLARSWERRADITGILVGRPNSPLHLWLLLAGGVLLINNIIPQLPGCELPRDTGLATVTALGLWLAALRALRKGPVAEAQPPTAVPARLAA